CTSCERSLNYATKMARMLQSSTLVLRHPASTNFTEDIATVHTIIPIHTMHVPVDD
ncbi:hypothetical protein L9F63_026313, partial [Diploptera punctata]